MKGPAAAPLNQTRTVETNQTTKPAGTGKQDKLGTSVDYWCPHPQLRARYKRPNTNSHKSLSHYRLSLSRTYNSNTGVRVSRKTTQTSTDNL
ncbi:hypothetical protein Taro_001329 [Colocasia esculenta]|uniref:Uncharacterized protein n=1 Tax=Colocasia esculenta TaxID=4460 RepID=A0A843THG6_COLES|nr:hypothetical protein [Colocasia esculenta]